LVQVTLSGEYLLEERFYLLGFVGADILGLAKDVWFPFGAQSNRFLERLFSRI
jgi:hypothetical protein